MRTQVPIFSVLKVKDRVGTIDDDFIKKQQIKHWQEQIFVKTKVNADTYDLIF